MKDEYIRKADAVDRMNRYGSIWMEYTEGMSKHEVAEQALKASKQAVIDVLENLPSIDVAPVRYGRWLPIVSYNHTYKCSECGRLLVDITDGLKMVAKHYPYCHCGAKMDGGENGRV